MAEYVGAVIGISDYKSVQVLFPLNFKYVQN